MKPAYMIDIETLSTRPTAAVTQIGAVLFDMDGEPGTILDSFEVNVKPSDGAHIDAETVMWWLDPARQAPAASLMVDRLPEEEAARTLLYFFLGTTPGVPVWACPPSFDLVILGSMFLRCGQALPWNFRAPQDLRTLRQMQPGGYTKKTRKQAQALFDGDAHNALYDAKYQAAEVQILRRLVGLVKP